MSTNSVMTTPAAAPSSPESTPASSPPEAPGNAEAVDVPGTAASAAAARS